MNPDEQSLAVWCRECEDYANPVDLESTVSGRLLVECGACGETEVWG